MNSSPEDYIRRTFELARRGLGTTWPNPLVGCVIVKDGKIIGEGFHVRPGSGHAEVEALNTCTEPASGATVYVNLEPCCHTTKLTPPCAQRLIEEKIQKVVVSNLDPNPEVSGRGLALLKAAGIEVESGILSKEGELLNEVFFTAQRKRRPFIHLKLAASLDGRVALATGESQWITGEKAREHVHLLRAQHQAIMVGGGTWRKDSPKLDVRLPGYSGPQPKRVVISKTLRDSSLMVFPDIREALNELFHQRIYSVLLEGGPKLAGSFLDLGLVDRASIYLNPSFIGEGLPMLENFSLTKLNDRPRLRNISTQLLGEDLYLTGQL